MTATLGRNEDLDVLALKQPGRRGRGLLIVLFAIYLLLLAWIVLWKLQVPYVGSGALRDIKLVPFIAYGSNGPSAPSEVAANFLLFVPFGLYVGLLNPDWRWWRTAGVLAGSSLLAEITQYVLAIGSTDVTDVIMNTAGGMAGLGLLVVARHWLHGRTAVVMGGICSIATVLVLVLIGLLWASPVQFGQHDVTVPGQSVPGEGGQLPPLTDHSG